MYITVLNNFFFAKHHCEEYKCNFSSELKNPVRNLERRTKYTVLMTEETIHCTSVIRKSEDTQLHNTGCLSVSVGCINDGCINLLFSNLLIKCIRT